MSQEAKGVTRWRRSAIVGLPAVAAVVGMTAAMYEGVLASSISLTTDQMNISSGRIAAPGGVVALPDTVGSGNAASSELGIPTAFIEGLCVHAKHTFTIGTVSVPVDLYIYTPNDGNNTYATVNNDANIAKFSGLALNTSSLNLPSVTLTPNSPTSAVYLGEAATNNAAAGIQDGAGQFELDATQAAADIASLNATPQQAAITTTTTLTNFGLGINKPGNSPGSTVGPVCN
ncbi:MAG: hypothetical protein HOV83_04055 [Catenulispora sp.]|nr:hypothetical protein [Catenulispora sp.]